MNDIYCTKCEKDTEHDVNFGCDETRWDPADPGYVVCVVCGTYNEDVSPGQIAQDLIDEKADHDYQDRKDERVLH